MGYMAKYDNNYNELTIICNFKLIEFTHPTDPFKCKQLYLFYLVNKNDEYTVIM